MDSNGGGCFPSQRTIGRKMGITHKTAAKALRALQATGWLEVEAVRRQFGRIGHRYYAAVPGNGEHDSPFDDLNGDTQIPQSANGESERGLNGESFSRIGESGSKIGDTQIPQTLTDSITERSAASPSPADAGSAARKVSEETRAEILRLHADGLTPQKIASRIRQDCDRSCHTAVVLRVLASIATASIATASIATDFRSPVGAAVRSSAQGPVQAGQIVSANHVTDV
jgi:hypothetical protein